jgi:hypothetical protein
LTLADIGTHSQSKPSLFGIQTDPQFLLTEHHQVFELHVPRNLSSDTNTQTYKHIQTDTMNEKVIEKEVSDKPIEHSKDNTQVVPVSTSRAPGKEASNKPDVNAKRISFGVPRHSDAPLRSLNIPQGNPRKFASRYGSMATRATDDDPAKLHPRYQNSMAMDLERFTK